MDHTDTAAYLSAMALFARWTMLLKREQLITFEDGICKTRDVVAQLFCFGMVEGCDTPFFGAQMRESQWLGRLPWCYAVVRPNGRDLSLVASPPGETPAFALQLSTDIAEKLRPLVLRGEMDLRPITVDDAGTVCSVGQVMRTVPVRLLDATTSVFTPLQESFERRQTWKKHQTG